MFFFQYLVQAGLFFIVPLFLSVVLGLSAIATGVRLLPLSIALLVGRGRDPQAVAEGVSRAASSRIGLLPCSPGSSPCSSAIDADAGARGRHRPDAAHRARRRARWPRSSGA